MKISDEEKEFLSHVLEMMHRLIDVKAKSMFGGYGIFKDGLMFALIAESNLYFKVDKDSKLDFEEKGLDPFVYSKKGKDVKMSYYMAPEDVFEDDIEMAFWANKAYNSAVKAAVLKKKKSK